MLGAWLLGRLWGDTDNSAALHTFTTVSWFENVQRAFDLAEMPPDHLASGRLLNWVLWSRTSSHPGPIDISIDTSTPILRMLVVTACKLGVQPGFQLRPSQWLLESARSIETVISHVEAARDLVAAVGITDIAGQATALRAVIGEAVAEQRTILEEQLVQTQVDPARVQTFTAAVRDGWSRCRIGATLLQQAGADEEVDGHNPDTRFGYWLYEPKDWYVDDHVGGLESHA